MTFLIGVNGGGSHTDFVLTDLELKPLARFETGPTNYANIGVEAAQREIQTGIDALLQAASVERNQIAAIGAGMSGIARPEDRTVFIELFQKACPNVPIFVDNDAVAALVAGAGRRFGIVTISGTGSIAIGYNEAGQQAHSGGWGHIIDGGGGYAIARQILAAIFAAYDGSGPATKLTERVLNRLTLSQPPDLMDWLYAQDRRVGHIATLTAEAVQIADEDQVAASILGRAAESLSVDAITVARKLALTQFPLVMSGSLFKYSSLLRNLFIKAVQAAVPGAEPISGDHDPAVGAAHMALDGIAIQD